MSGGGGGGIGGLIKSTVGSSINMTTGGKAQNWGFYRKQAEKRGINTDQSYEDSVLGSFSGGLLGGEGNAPEAPTPDAAPTMEDIASREPDKERRRKQRMAALMAQGRQGSILTGPSGSATNNLVGGGGKQLAGA
jgi:hypothetical protein